MVRVFWWSLVFAQESKVCPEGLVATGSVATPCCPLNQAPLRGKPGTCVDIVSASPVGGLIGPKLPQPPDPDAPVFGTSGIQRPRPDPNTAEVSLRADLTVVVGKARRELVEAGLAETVPAVRACYVERLAERPELYGLVAMQLTVTQKGEITEVTPYPFRSTARDQAIEACVLDAVRAVTFAERPGGAGHSTVQATWELHPPKAPKTHKAPAP